MHDSKCLRLRMLGACLQSYESITPGHDKYQVQWLDLGPLVPNPLKIPDEPDVALVGRIEEGIVVVFRGTRPPGPGDDRPFDTMIDWLNDANCIPIRSHYPGRVHKGFERSVSNLWSEVRKRVEAMIESGAPPVLFVTGHSKGGAMAFLAAWRLAREIQSDIMIRVITFAAARPGDTDFANGILAEPRIKSIRYEIRRDIVPLLPPGPDFGSMSALIATVFPRLKLDRLPKVYVGVGKAEIGGERTIDRAASLGRELLGLFRGRRPRWWSPREIVDSHAIIGGSAYSRLANELADCDHG